MESLIEGRNVVIKAGSGRWTNKSVLRFAKDRDPVSAIEQRVRDIVLEAKDAGWSGPPFNPIELARFLNIPVDATADVSDARTIAQGGRLRIQYNPQQPRERARFSIAHEIAHTFFSDAHESVRHRGGDPTISDDWQLETLCNLAAAEMIMPVGSLPRLDVVPPIEELMRQRRNFDVSAEAYLVRVTKAAAAPISMFVASRRPHGDSWRYKIEYAVRSDLSPPLAISDEGIPPSSVVYHCTAIGVTDRATERWSGRTPATVEAVGLPGFKGSRFPRVAGLIRHNEADQTHDCIRIVHGNVLEPRPGGLRIVCQLTNDKAIRWGGGVARQMAARFPSAHDEYAEWLKAIPRSERLGEVFFSKVTDDLVIASLVAQEGYGPTGKGIRYRALEKCLREVAKYAIKTGGSVHMPKLGASQGPETATMVEEIIRAEFGQLTQKATIYEIPPQAVQGGLGF